MKETVIDLTELLHGTSAASTAIASSFVKEAVGTTTTTTGGVLVGITSPQQELLLAHSYGTNTSGAVTTTSSIISSSANHVQGHYKDHDDFVTATLIVDCHCELGEGIIYDDTIHAVLWTDILKRQFHKLQLGTSTSTNAPTTSNNTNMEQTRIVAVHTVYDLPKMLCSFGMLDTKSKKTLLLEEEEEKNVDDDRSTSSMPLLCAWEDGFQLYDVIRGIPLSEMSLGECVNPMKLPSRLNDGRVDPYGIRYICGGYYGELPSVQMKVYKVEQKKVVEDEEQNNKDNVKYVLYHEPIVDSISTTNSICWSLDGTIMYLADSPTKQIYSYKYNPMNGSISNKAVVHTKFPLPDVDVPDGSCVDKEGYIWNAVWCSGTKSSYVQRIDPMNGLVVFTVHIPHRTSQITCCCFGGIDMNILFISTACESIDRTKEVHAGGLYAAKVPFYGKKESRLQFCF